MNILIIIALLLAVLVVIRLMNVSQLASVIAGEDEEAEQKRHNSMNGLGLMLFSVVGILLMIYMTFKYQPFLLPESASAHGVKTDFLLNINFAVIGIVFLATQILMFWFVYKYQHSKNRFALFYPDNHKLEIIWTVVPTIVLSALIVTGLKEWNKMTQSHPQDGMVVQVYGYQFNWIARYAGQDNKLGRSFYKLITDDNPLGIDYSDPASKDDIMTKGNEMHLPKGVPVMFEFNSRDVIHSAYFPHFRTQMNCVPGMTTRFYMEPTITTAEMKGITKNEKFEYVLLCNKVCGVAHYNMKMNVVVDDPAEFKNWLKGQKQIMAPVPSTTASEVVKVNEEKENNI
ncbi:MAG: cytochrome c oxidase subunit II [Bacteroidetes bacterium]|nr:cytochrome c oxidase subunit II [Bacteroidota bacterium]